MPVVAALLIARLLGARKPRVPVPSVIPWKALRDSAAPGARKKRFSPLLWLELACAALAILAASGPSLPRDAPGGGALLVLLDRSASMNAPAPGGGSRFDAARRAIEKEVSGLAPSTRILLRGFPPFPEGDVETAAAGLPARLREARPTDVAGSLADALRGSGGDPGAASVRGILAASDGAGPGLAPPANARFLWVGGDVPNAGIEALRVEPDGKGAYRVFVRVRNASSAPASLRLAARAGDAPLGPPVALSVPPGAARGVTLFEEVRLPGEVLEVRLEPPDAFPADDRVHAVSGAARGLAIGMAGRDAPYLARALEAVPGARVSALGEGGASSADFDLLVFHGSVPSADPPCPCAVVAPSSDFLGLKLARLADPGPLSVEPALGESAKGLAVLRFSRVVCVENPPPGAEILCRCGGKAAVFRAPGARGALWFVGLPVDGESSDWPREPWFPIFWKDLAAREAAGGGDAPGDRRTGRVVSLAIAEGEEFRVEGPDGRRIEAAVRGRTASFVPESTGVYRVVSRARGETRVAVNLLSPEESDLRGRAGSEGELPAAFTQPAGTAAVPVAHAFTALALVALAAIVILETGRRALPATAPR